MKLLIVTQTVDTQDPVLGFFVRWIEEFAKNAEEVTVICLNKGAYSLPKNVRVFSLGKECAARSAASSSAAQNAPQTRAPRFARRLSQRVTYTLRFLSLVWRERAHYDSVFVHMNPEYIVLAGGLWKLMGKRISLWYTHKSVTPILRMAVLFADTIFTASRESFRLINKKVRVMGHGIDIEQFTHNPSAPATQTRHPYEIRILTTGRLSATKRIMEMLGALDILAKRNINFSFTIAGAPATDSDTSYEKKVLSALAERPYKNSVHTLGAVSHKDIPKLLAKHDVFLNLSTTGSMDKAVLEALASGVPAVTTNIAFRELLAPAPGLFIETDTPSAIADAIITASTADITTITQNIRQHYALPQLIKTICTVIET